MIQAGHTRAHGKHMTTFHSMSDKSSVFTVTVQAYIKDRLVVFTAEWFRWLHCLPW